MVKLPRTTADRAIRAIERDGWFKVAQTGSHVTFRHATKPGYVSVPRSPGDLAIGNRYDREHHQASGADRRRVLGPALAEETTEMRRYTYTVVLVPEGDRYVVHVPALPGAVTEGASVAEALAMAEDLICVWLHGEAPRPEADGVHAQLATVTVEVEVVDGLVRSSGVAELAPA